MIGRQVGGVGFWKSHGLRFQLPESPFWRKVWEFVDLGRCWRGRGEGEEEEKRKKEGGGISQKFDTSARRRRGHGGAVRTSADQCGISECRCAASLALKFFFYFWTNPQSSGAAPPPPSSSGQLMHAPPAQQRVFPGLWHTAGPARSEPDLHFSEPAPESACAVHAGAHSLSGGELHL